MPEPSKSTVPAGTPDPIQYLVDGGRRVIDLAIEWGFASTDSVVRLKRFAHVPPVDTAQKMAATFGWTPGDVVDHWLARKQERERAEGEAAS